jgi:ethanolamine utilization protein EutN
MQLSRVVGHAVATVKHPTLKGWRLLIVQPLAADGTEDGDPLLAIDNLGAAREDLVILSYDLAGVDELMGHSFSPVRGLVMGICD